MEMPGLCFCVRICLMGGPDTNEPERAGEGRGGEREGRGRAKEPTNMPQQSDTTSRADTYPCPSAPSAGCSGWGRAAG